MQEGDILTAREAAYIEQLEIENGKLQRAAITDMSRAEVLAALDAAGMVNRKDYTEWYDGSGYLVEITTASDQKIRLWDGNFGPNSEGEAYAPLLKIIALGIANLESSELQVNVLSAAAPAATWLLPSNGLPPKDEETSHPHSISCLIVHHGCRVSLGFFHLPHDPDNPGSGFDEVARDSVYIDAWMPLPVPPEELWTQYLLDKNIGKKVMKEFMAEAAKRQREPAPTPVPAPFSMTEADCIAADLHNSRNKAPKAYSAQTKSAVALEFKHAQQGVAV